MPAVPDSTYNKEMKGCDKIEQRRGRDDRTVAVVFFKLFFPLLENHIVVSPSLSKRPFQKKKKKKEIQTKTTKKSHTHTHEKKTTKHNEEI